MILNAPHRKSSKRNLKRKGKSRPNRVGIPIDPVEYEARRVAAQRACDRFHGPGRYRVVGEVGEMLYLVNWVDYPLLQQSHRAVAHAIQPTTSHAA